MAKSITRKNIDRYDARGHRVLDWFTLKEKLIGCKGHKVLCNNLWHKIVVHGFTQVRVMKELGEIHVLEHGTGQDVTRVYCLTDRRLKALRKLYKAPKSGWVTSIIPGGVACFTRAAWVMLDNTGKYTH